MMSRKIQIIVCVSFLFISTITHVSAEPFDWIMNSISKAGALDNGDGHYWEFRKNSLGNWEVEGAQGEVATVVLAGENKVELDGFPFGWDANGKFNFSRASGKCILKSDHSGHELEWTC